MASHVESTLSGWRILRMLDVVTLRGGTLEYSRLDPIDARWEQRGQRERLTVIPQVLSARTG